MERDVTFCCFYNSLTWVKGKNCVGNNFTRWMSVLLLFLIYISSRHIDQYLLSYRDKKNVLSFSEKNMFLDEEKMITQKYFNYFYLHWIETKTIRIENALLNQFSSVPARKTHHAWLAFMNEKSVNAFIYRAKITCIVWEYSRYLQISFVYNMSM